MQMASQYNIEWKNPNDTRNQNRNVVTSPRQNRSPLTPHKQGVRVIYGIPYTRDEQNTLISMEQIRKTITDLCRDQHRNPNFATYEVELIGHDDMYLPDANELISYSVRNSERIQSH